MKDSEEQNEDANKWPESEFDYYEPIEEQPYSLRDEGRNPDGTGESYAERNH